MRLFVLLVVSALFAGCVAKPDPAVLAKLKERSLLAPELTEATVERRASVTFFNDVRYSDDAECGGGYQYIYLNDRPVLLLDPMYPEQKLYLEGGETYSVGIKTVTDRSSSMISWEKFTARDTFELFVRVFSNEGDGKYGPCDAGAEFMVRKDS